MPPRKTIRLLLACMVLLAFLLVFTRFDSFYQAGRLLSATQFVPAILSIPSVLAIIAVGLIVVITLVSGRIYCSILCPLGLLQDLMIRIARLSGKRHFVSLPPLKSLHFTLTIIVAASASAGFLLPILALEPFAAFGRTATTLFQPLTTWFCRLLAPFATDGINWFSQASYKPANMVTTVFTIGFVVLLFAACTRWGRIYCNSLCPAGAILRLIAQFSVFQLAIKDDSCGSCGLCAKVCKAGCIDSGKKTIDFSRCIGCFNCLAACQRHAITMQHSPATSVVTAEFASGRRAALGCITAATAGYLLPGMTMEQNKNATAIVPPGAMDFARFKKSCIACQLCVTACPSSVIRPGEALPGLPGILQPVLDFSMGMCEQNCNLCSQICPVNAIQPVDAAQKKLLKIGEVVYQKSLCVVETKGKDCGACAEHCPTQAVRMVPYQNNLMIPEITPSICIGCGSCEHICPVRPLKAIVVKPVNQQTFIKLPEPEPLENSGALKDFPF